MSNKKNLFGVVLVSIILTGVLLSAPKGHGNVASANFLDNVLNFLKKPLSPVAQNITSTQQPASLYKPAIDYESAVIDAVQKSSPSVVSIVISKDLPVIENCPENPFSNLPPDFQEFFGQNFQFSEPCQKGTQLQEIGGGSGFVVASDGLIVTNKHVVSDMQAQYTVLTNDGKKYDAKVLARDPVQDLAVIKINATGLTPATLGDSDTLKLGQTAIAIGNALGEFRNTVSVGVVSGLARTITAGTSDLSGEETIQGVIQTDAAINPGNSGGPLLNLRGEVIGINTAIVSGAQNIGFAIPINQIKKDVQSVRATGAIKTVYLGVRYVLVTDDIEKAQNLSVNYGALVRGDQNGPAVIAGSPADKARLQAEDIILSVNGEKITPDNPLSLIIQKYNVGDKLNLQVQRGGQVLSLFITLAQRPGNL